MRDGEKTNDKFARVTDLGLIKRIKTGAKTRTGTGKGTDEKKKKIQFGIFAHWQTVYTVLMKFGGRRALNHPHRPKQLLYLYIYSVYVGTTVLRDFPLLKGEKKTHSLLLHFFIMIIIAEQTQ